MRWSLTGNGFSIWDPDSILVRRTYILVCSLVKIWLQLFELSCWQSERTDRRTDGGEFNSPPTSLCEAVDKQMKPPECQTSHNEERNICLVTLTFTLWPWHLWPRLILAIDPSGHIALWWCTTSPVVHNDHKILMDFFFISVPMILQKLKAHLLKDIMAKNPITWKRSTDSGYVCISGTLLLVWQSSKTSQMLSMGVEEF